MEDKTGKIDLLIIWLTDMESRTQDSDDRRILEDTIGFLKDERETLNE